MHVIFVTNQYLPTPMANGVCVHEVARSLVEGRDRVTVICPRGKDDSSSSLLDGVHILRVERSFASRLVDSNKENKSKFGNIMHILGTLLRRCGRLIHLKHYPLEDMGLVHRYIAAVETILKESDTEVTLVATYTPMEAVYAVGCLSKKHKNLKTVFYSLDTMSNESGRGFLPRSVRSNLGSKNEIEIFRLFQRVILMRCHERHYSGESYNDVRNRFVYADFPLFHPSANNCAIKKNVPKAGIKRLIYAGSFYRWIRNPELVMKQLAPILDQIKLDFYGYSDCDDIIQPYVDRHKGHVAIHGLVQRATVMREMAETDVVLSIGNSSTEMSPSKIYECIATGKPVLHFYFQENDPCIEVLKKYSNSMCVDVQGEMVTQQILAFIQNAHDVDSTLLSDIFCESTPKYTAGIILGDVVGE